MSERGEVVAGQELSVGAAKEPLPPPVEEMLLEVVQARDDVAFASVPMIAFPGQVPERVLVVFLRGGSDPEAALAALSAGVAAGFEAVAAAHPAVAIEPMAVMPVPLDRPLDGLAQAVVMTDTHLLVADVAAWQRARRGPQPWWRRLLGW